MEELKWEDSSGRVEGGMEGRRNMFFLVSCFVLHSLLPSDGFTFTCLVFTVPSLLNVSLETHLGGGFEVSNEGFIFRLLPSSFFRSFEDSVNAFFCLLFCVITDVIDKVVCLLRFEVDAVDKELITLLLWDGDSGSLHSLTVF